MRAMVYRGTSGCRVIVQSRKPASSRQPRLLSLPFARPSRRPSDQTVTNRHNQDEQARSPEPAITRRCGAPR